jgi:hypothetical protein
VTVHLVTFGSRPEWSLALKRLQKQVRNHPYISCFKIYDNHDLRKLKLLNDHQEFIDKNKRGFGYWIWKPAIMLDALQYLKENDILIYMDAGCELNVTKGANQRFLDYLMLSSTYEGINFKLNLLEQNWTHPEVFQKLHGVNTSFQTMAGIIIIRKTSNSKTILKNWFNLMIVENYKNVLGSISLLDRRKYPYFQEHRHDQSIWSLTSSKWNFLNLPDETYFHSGWVSEGQNFPFWSTRNTSMLPVNTPKLVLLTYQYFGEFIIKTSSKLLSILRNKLKMKCSRIFKGF